MPEGRHDPWRAVPDPEPLAVVIAFMLAALVGLVVLAVELRGPDTHGLAPMLMFLAAACASIIALGAAHLIRRALRRDDRDELARRARGSTSTLLPPAADTVSDPRGPAAWTPDTAPMPSALDRLLEHPALPLVVVALLVVAEVAVAALLRAIVAHGLGPLLAFLAAGCALLALLAREALAERASRRASDDASPRASDSPHTSDPPREPASERLRVASRVTVQLQPDQTCPFCHDGLAGRSPADLLACSGCAAVFHRDCLGEAPSCTTIGCRNRRSSRRRQRDAGG